MNINSGYLQIAMEPLITFSVLLLLTRILGKKQLSHLTFFNYVTGITVGSMKNVDIKSVEEVFYAEIQTDGKLFIQKE